MQAIIHQLSTHHSQQYITYPYNKNLFYYCSLRFIVVLPYVFYIIDCSQTCSLSTFKQRIVIHMHICTHGGQTIVTDTSKIADLWTCYFCNTVFILIIAIPFTGIIFCYQQVYSGGFKNNQKTNLVA